MVPLSCYWSIVVLLFWVLLTVTTPVGYSITGMEYISKHLYFNILETTVLCMQLVGGHALSADRKPSLITAPLVVRLHTLMDGVWFHGACVQ